MASCPDSDIRKNWLWTIWFITVIFSWAKLAKPVKKYANQIFLSLFYIDVKESEIIFCESNCTNSLIFANKSIKFHLANFIHEDDLLRLKCANFLCKNYRMIRCWAKIMKKKIYSHVFFQQVVNLCVPHNFFYDCYYTYVSCIYKAVHSYWNLDQVVTNTALRH